MTALPFTQALSQDRSNSKGQHVTGRLGTVMIVDDEAFDVRCAKRVLDRSGLADEILCFDCPEKALAFLHLPERPEIDIILMDINMPRLTGFEFLERASQELEGDFAHVVVVMLTTSLARRDLDMAESFDVIKDYIPKPLMAKHVDRLCQLLADTKSQAES